MRVHRFGNLTSRLLGIIALTGASLLLVGQQAQAQTATLQDEIGYAEFRLHCAVCHGVNGSGNGSIAGLLNVKADKLDLTDLKIKSDEGYPFRWVYQVIDGRQNVNAHGERMMPVWGDRYSLDAGERYEPYDRKAVITGRILELVYYIQSIQKLK